MASVSVEFDPDIGLDCFSSEEDFVLIFDFVSVVGVDLDLLGVLFDALESARGFSLAFNSSSVIIFLFECELLGLAVFDGLLTVLPAVLGFGFISFGDKYLILCNIHLACN